MTGLELALALIIGCETWLVWHCMMLVARSTQLMKKAGAALDHSRKINAMAGDEIDRLTAIVTEQEHDSSS